jgi:predicted component of type VI protein secretion system
MPVTLLPLDGGKPLPITLPITLVGHSEDCELRLDDEGVNELQSVLALADGFLFLRDLDTGGTRVNGRLVRRAILLYNDEFAVGNCRFRVSYEEGSSSQG